MIRYGRLVQQRCVPHTQEATYQVVQELLAHARQLGDPPSTVSKAEVDQINIISRWIHRHNEDRAFFPFHHTLVSEEEALTLCQRIWQDIDQARSSLSLTLRHASNGG